LLAKLFWYSVPESNNSLLYIRFFYFILRLS